MTTHVAGWTTLADEPVVLVKEYAFGPGRANALAIGLPGRRWLIVSPPPELAREEVAGLQQLGSVVALLASNGAHHLGLGPCRVLFPQAVTYAAPRAAARIRKKGKDFGQLDPLEQLEPLLGDRVSLVSVAGDKVGDVCVRVQTERGTLFYAGDFIANLQALPSNLLFRLFFKLTDSGPGLKVFNAFFKFFVADAGAARASLVNELERHPPAILVPAHGDVVARTDLGPTLVGMLRSA
jgi:hypothetical protein